MLQLPHDAGVIKGSLLSNRVGILIQRGRELLRLRRQTLEVLGKLEGLCS